MTFKNKVFSILLLGIPLYLTAQSTNIQGYVYSSNSNLPLEGVNISVQNSELGSITDKKGAFYLPDTYSIKVGDSLIFSYVGYVRTIISIEDIKKTNNRIYLKQHIEDLSEFVISAKSELNATLDFQVLSSMPKSLAGFGAVFVKSQNKIYIIGGDESYYEDNLKRRLSEDPSLSNPNSSIADLTSKTVGNLNWQNYNGDVLSYDISSDTWEKINLNLGKRAYHNSVLFKDIVYNIGGKRLKPNLQKEYLDNEIELFDLHEFEVLVDYTNPHQAVNFGSIAFSDNLLLFGGSTKIVHGNKKIYSKKVHLYNFSSGLWYELKSLPIALETSGIAVHQKLYIIGGFNNRALKQIGSYSLTTEEYTKEAELFEGIERPGLAQQGELIYIFNSGKLLTYDIGSKLLKEYIINLYMEGSKLILQDGYIYIFGGMIRNKYSERPSNKMVRIDLKTFDTTKVKRERNFE